MVDEVNITENKFSVFENKKYHVESWSSCVSD